MFGYFSNDRILAIWVDGWIPEVLSIIFVLFLALGFFLSFLDGDEAISCSSDSELDSYYLESFIIYAVRII